MKKLTWTIVIIFILLAGPVAAQFYRPFDEDAYLRFTDARDKAPAKKCANIREYGRPGAGLPFPLIDRVADIENSRVADAEPSENKMFGLLATHPDGTISLKDFRTQIEKMKETLEAEYLALAQERNGLAIKGDLNRGREELVVYNESVDAFNQWAENYEKMRIKLSKLVDEYNTFLCFSLR